MYSGIRTFILFVFVTYTDESFFAVDTVLLVETHEVRTDSTAPVDNAKIKVRILFAAFIISSPD